MPGSKTHETNVQMTIKQLDLKRQLDTIRPEIDAAMATILDNTAFIGGAAVKNFEQAFAEFCETQYCIGVGNGTDALMLIFQALGLKAGDEVITTPMTFIATSEPLMMLGVKPIFVDIEPDTYNLDAVQVAEKITTKTKALLPVHLYGQPATLEPLQQLAKTHNLFLIEDCAQAHGARYQDQRVGSVGIAGAFSFYPGKNLGAFGDGGAVVTSDQALADTIRMLADHGRTTKYEHDLIGVNSRLDGLQAAILAIKLKRLAAWNEGRAKWAALYNQRLSDIPAIHLPKVRADRTHVYHQYIVRLNNPADREPLMAFLQARGVSTGIHYPVPLHRQPAFQSLGYQLGDFPVSEQLANACVSLPMYAELQEAEVHYVADAVRAFFENT